MDTKLAGKDILRSQISTSKMLQKNIIVSFHHRQQLLFETKPQQGRNKHPPMSLALLPLKIILVTLDLLVSCRQSMLWKLTNGLVH
jgi:hypothetical protein